MTLAKPGVVEQCGNCNAYVDGACHARPPQLVVKTYGSHGDRSPEATFETKWPEPPAEAWCREWEKILPSKSRKR
jgi:hypothetical protein